MGSLSAFTTEEAALTKCNALPTCKGVVLEKGKYKVVGGDKKIKKKGAKLMKKTSKLA